MPRMGIGMPLVASSTGEAAIIIVDDEFFESFDSGDISLNYTQFRQNDVLYSQDTSNAAWVKTESAISGTLFEAPDNSSTANAITGSANNNAKFLAQDIGILAGTTYTLSVHLKKQNFGFGRVKASDGTNTYFADFNLTTGAVGTTSGLISSGSFSVDSTLGGGGWFRCRITFQATAGHGEKTAQDSAAPGSVTFQALSADNNTTVSVAVGGTILMYTWGFQLEQDIEETAYLPTTGSVARVTTVLADNHKAWDFDGADSMPEADPDGEGAWEVNSDGDLVPQGV